MICNCNNSSTPRPNKLSWCHLKIIINNSVCLSKIIDIANTCFDIGFWPSHFKTSMSIIIPKPNKNSYNSLKSFRPIVLLNMIGKLIEKIIGERLQFCTITNDFIHFSQLGGLKKWLTIDASVTLTHFIHMEWVNNINTSMLTFDISQFFPSLNHYLLPKFFDKVGFDLKASKFFGNYLVGQQTKYIWNDFFSQLFSVDVEVGQVLWFKAQRVKQWNNSCIE